MATKKKPSGPSKRGGGGSGKAVVAKRVGSATKGTQMDPGRKAKQAALDKRKSGPPKKRTKKTPAPRRPY